jgi:hypothetical protein
MECVSCARSNARSAGKVRATRAAGANRMQTMVAGQKQRRRWDSLLLEGGNCVFAGSAAFCAAPGPSISACAVHQTDQRLAFAVTAQVVEHDFDSAIRLGHTGDVGCQHHAGVMPQRMVRRERFRVRYIQHGGAELSAFQCLQQMILLQMPAAARVDQRGPARQLRKQIAVQDMTRGVGERQPECQCG